MKKPAFWKLPKTPTPEGVECYCERLLDMMASLHGSGELRIK